MGQLGGPLIKKGTQKKIPRASPHMERSGKTTPFLGPARPQPYIGVDFWELGNLVTRNSNSFYQEFEARLP